MKVFRFETEVQTTVTLEYIIESETLEEALNELQTGQYRKRYTDKVAEEYNWSSETIVIKEELEE